MFSRKLKALGWHHPDLFSLKDECDVRNLVVWLEDIKIRLYKIDDRDALRAIDSENWIDALKKYLIDLKCPISNLSQKPAVINWLLSHAIHLEYAENSEKLNKFPDEHKLLPSNSIVDLMRNLKGDDPQVAAGVESIRKLLNIPGHYDSALVLQAVTKTIEERFSEEVMNERNNKETTNEEYLSLENTILGFDTNDYVINDAAKILRHLHIRNLRELQTKVNQAIVAVQNLSADPKTDHSLGRVGR